MRRIRERNINRYQEGMWDDVKGVFSKKKNAGLFENVNKADVMKDIIMILLFEKESLLKNPSFPNIIKGDKSKAKEVLESYNKIGYSFEKRYSDDWRKAGELVKKFFIPLDTHWAKSLLKKVGVHDVNLLNDADIEQIEYIKNDSSIESLYEEIKSNFPSHYQKDTITSENAVQIGSEAHMRAKDILHAYSTVVLYHLQTFMKYAKEVLDDYLNYSDELRKKYFSQNKLTIGDIRQFAVFFKYFYPSERVDEFRKKFNMSVSDFRNATSNMIPPSQEEVRSMMSAKEKVTLKSYLEKKLTISEKESQLIEKVIKNYLKEVKTFKVTWDSETEENKKDFSDALIKSKTYDLQEDNSQRWKEILDTAIKDNNEIKLAGSLLTSVKRILSDSKDIHDKMTHFNKVVDHNFIFSESDDLITIFARMRQFFKYVISKQKEYSFIDIYNLKKKVTSVYY